MKKPKLFVKTFYDSLDVGKLIGSKCNRCGSYEFPPLYSCNECSAHNVELAEVSGDAEVVEFLLPEGIMVNAKNDDLIPYAIGAVKLKEGPSMRTIILGISKENEAEIRVNLPYSVKAEIIQREGYKQVVYRIIQ